MTDTKSMAVDINSTTTIESSPAKLLGLATINAALIAVSVFLAMGFVKESGHGAWSVQVGWAGIVFFGAILLLTLKRLFAGRQVMITLSPTGIRDVRVSAKEIPWNDIEAVGTWKFQRQKLLVVKVPPEVEANLGLTFMAKATRKMNAHVQADGLALSAQGTTVNHDQLLLITLAYLEHYRGLSSPD